MANNDAITTALRAIAMEYLKSIPESGVPYEPSMTGITRDDLLRILALLAANRTMFIEGKELVYDYGAKDYDHVTIRTFGRTCPGEDVCVTLRGEKYPASVRQSKPGGKAAVGNRAPSHFAGIAVKRNAHNETIFIPIPGRDEDH